MAVLITGATGNVGLEVANTIADKGIRVFVGVRNVPKSASLFKNGVELREFDFEKPETYSLALQGIDKIFLVRPPAISDVKKHIIPFLEEARKQGVLQVVFLSLLGAEKNIVVPHYKIEQHLISCGMSYTFLRAGFFMQNLITTHLNEIRLDNEIVVPAGQGKTSFIDVRDIAAVGALTLTEPGHENKAYDLTGKEALDYYQVADMLTDVLGRSITYRNPSLMSFYRRMRARGIEAAFVLVMLGIYTTTKLGMAQRITMDVQKLLGREPITMPNFIKDFKDCWI